ncbi:YceI family protein [Mycobacterium sp. GA-2829]|uniref:YceI family protein n=1 Tax=Mycobacterium sp. GA-2829 TaxID=1772283 RepID=UPI000740258B|nr:YceI family protein [Mycobacterium sp. GA-2829]KUI26523.1 hypothetical protein AU194_05710 [Mycobacterium sp. GA-2829]
MNDTWGVGSGAEHLERGGSTADDESHWRVDPERTSISFTARWLFGLATATGTFASSSGWVVLKSNGELSGEIAAEVSGVATGNRFRDRHLQGRLFFDAEHHPSAVFSSGVCITGDGRFAGDGSLSLRGRTAKVHAEGTFQRDTDHLRLTGDTVLDTRVFGLPSAGGYLRRDVLVSVDVWLDRAVAPGAE